MKPQPCKIVPLLPRHASEMMRLRHAALREAPTAFGTDPDWELAKTEAHYQRYLLRIAARRRECILGIRLGETLVGMNGLGVRRQEDTLYGLIYSMFILPKARGQGLGAALLAHSCRHAHDSWSLTRCRITVETHNWQARRLYERHGFTFLFRETAAFSLKGIDYDVDHLDVPLPLSPSPFTLTPHLDQTR